MTVCFMRLMLELRDDSVGTALPNSSLDVILLEPSPYTGNLSISFTERTVTLHEQITTLTGKFACIKVNSKMIVKNELVNPWNATSISWYSSKVGLIRVERHLNGKLRDYSELTKIKFP